MRRSILSLLAAVSPLAAQAADLGTIFPADEAVCYARDFDAAYLEQHPEQRVTSMRIVRPLDPALQRLEAEEKENFKTTGPNFIDVAFARIGVRARKTGSRMWSGYFSCDQSRDGRKDCSSGECDGGGMLIDATDDGGATVYFDPDPGSYQRYFVVVGCDDAPPEHGSISFSIETDSAPFLLDRVNGPVRRGRYDPLNANRISAFGNLWHDYAVPLHIGAAIAGTPQICSRIEPVGRRGRCRLRRPFLFQPRLPPQRRRNLIGRPEPGLPTTA